METGLLIALGFAAAIVVLAVALTRLTRRKPRRERDRSAAAATWVGIDRAKNSDEGGQ